MNDVLTNVKPAQPTATTPGMKGQDQLTALASDLGAGMCASRTPRRAAPITDNSEARRTTAKRTTDN